MKILPFFIQSILNFVFPKNPKILVLEALSAEEIHKSLPAANGPEKSDVIALFNYSHPLVKEIVWEVKYGGNAILSARLGEILYDTIIQELEERNLLSESSRTILMPMPISGKRRFERGWNQAELLARAAKRSDAGNILKYVPGQLVKILHTESQTKTASKSERMKNLEGSMKVMNPLSVEGRLIVLVDDVVTTGSTFAEARRALKEAGAKKILCFAIAH
ncbi:MAG: Phosphoribosyltransferase [Parcubacteria group bacterium GW2011_GWB1_49_7]|uniref:Phosphoribosyltransferase domain-containing protein n=1 Tax=Candidatus Zambryskibacteria bacterium RIFCSPHIGHO2_01_FULL_46_25 TaxID=1802738 RepID=A0A1G2T034_9BACT|nr:MAG: Phosphoribosyltransferase [Parcubacteria group bacterium GW2011_GWA1_47_10]KKW09882.1 MAG: Phosphoribosyltransferase [Parcubacteria group bacterium GW2011_GWB1_49_7]OHA90656.1 MAG: hypothetical protein A2838_02985 [Candidatus Zambryskibacteria bacterium RIFCSPHIGHO2_01_FULL_46_25]OHB00600.1 MAG: hypothetical protein A3F53_02035 [Candidatus Zambryskibacteria bacterium RIFCSPHIGHO2_12_FULL_48_10]OHB07299.1 MAG: hypothetical protein A3A31_02125 [Candidatus Zambryskibacteria bacterium RIFCS